MCEEYFESEEYKIKNQKSHEACVEKYRAYLPLHNDTLKDYINRWADLREYLITHYHTCTTNELKRLFFKEFFKKRDELIEPEYNYWIIDNLKNLLSFCEGNTRIDFFKEFIEEKLKEHSGSDPQYILEEYFCGSNQEIYLYYVKKMNEAKTDFEKMEITRAFREELKCLSRPMNIKVFLNIRIGRGLKQKTKNKKQTKKKGNNYVRRRR